MPVTTTADDGAAQGTAATDGDGSGSVGGEDTVASTDAMSTDATGDDTGAPPPEFSCEARDECVLHSDCCSCQALHQDEPAPSCADQSCPRGQCEIWGVKTLLCSHTCHIRLLDCDPAMVICDDAAPACDDGFSPWVSERCWSGRCIPDALCKPY